MSPLGDNPSSGMGVVTAADGSSPFVSRATIPHLFRSILCAHLMRALLLPATASRDRPLLRSK